jgi:fibronectin-binding autotransporter adhesin
MLLYGGSVFQNGASSNLVISPITLGVGSGDNCVFNIAGVSMTVSNAIGGPGNLVKTNTSPLILAGTNTYTGTTIVSNGAIDLVGSGSISASSAITLVSGAVLDVSGRADKTLNLASGQTLQGTGTVNGNLVGGSGSTVAPGLNGTGTLAVTNIVTLQGTTAMGVGAGSNNLLNGVSINYGGTLSLSFVPGSLASGNSFKLFNSPTSAYAGSFASITPATPGAGLTWDTSQLDTTGTLNVTSAVTLLPAKFGASSVSGATLVLTGTSGTHGGTYHVYSTTNATALTNETTAKASGTLVGSGSFDGSGNFSFTNSVSSTNSGLFFFLSEP